jgi:ABC-2 type transport system permease protein
MSAPATDLARTGVTASLYRLVLRTQATRGRLLTLGAIGLIGILASIAVATADTSSGSSATQRAVELIEGFGLSFLVPISALVMASASLGDFREDESLVYLWLRPVAAWRIIVAALAASVSVTLPLTVVPLVISAAIASGDGAVVGGTALSVTVAVIAYATVFLALGLRTHRAMLWGLVYVLLWEGFISRAGGAARLSISNYTRSILTHVTDTELDLAESSLVAGIVIPLAVAVVAFAYAWRRFRRQDVA